MTSDNKGLTDNNIQTSASSALSSIQPIPLTEELKKSYLDYAMSVIVSRALPDVRDGLKPVHRRIIYAMHETGNHHNKPYRKSARVVGEVMGKYHPHGDAAIYETMVRLAQDFSLRAPLVDGQGNFGSMDGDSAAAPRYTEARMELITHEMVRDIENGTVDFVPNYDGSLEEPTVLPARFPNLLVNGAGGIAVGMATYIPTHNLTEVINSCLEYIDNPDVSLDDLINRSIILGPDFPTGGILMGLGAVRNALRTGGGSVTVRAKTEIISLSGDKSAIIITEIPYQVNKAKLVEKIAELSKDKTIEGMSDIRDESNKDGVRIVIELKRNVNAEVILNQLFKNTQLQNRYSYNMLALVGNTPKKLSLLEIIHQFVEFRKEVIVRRSKHILNLCRDKAHILLGFAIAISDIDEVIAIIKSSEDRQDAKQKLLEHRFSHEQIAPFVKLVEGIVEAPDLTKLTEVQINAILELRLHRLTGLEREKIQNDLREIIEKMHDLISILGSKERVKQIMKDELIEVRDNFGTPRLTDVQAHHEDMDDEDLIQSEDMVVTYTLNGYIKRVPLSVYKAQKRGGKGRNGMDTKGDDLVKDIIIANTHDQLLFFLSNGKVYKIKTHKLPLSSPTSNGRAIINILPFEENASISTILVVPRELQRAIANGEATLPDESSVLDNANALDDVVAGGDEGIDGADDTYNDAVTGTDDEASITTQTSGPKLNQPTLMFLTSLGHVRRNKFSDFININANGKRAISLDTDKNEQLVGVFILDKAENQDIFIATKNGMCNRFPISQVRVFNSRSSTGVRGIKLKDEDIVISAEIMPNYSIESIQEREDYIKNAEQLRQSALNTKGGQSTILDPRTQHLISNEKFILTITEKGYGKLTSFYEYRSTNRATQGFTNISINSKNGNVVASLLVDLKDQIMIVSNEGTIMRFSVSDVRITHRISAGVIVFRASSDNEVINSVSVVREDEGE